MCQQQSVHQPEASAMQTQPLTDSEDSAASQVLQDGTPAGAALSHELAVLGAGWCISAEHTISMEDL